MIFKQAKLSNGLTILGEVRESAVSVALGFFVKTGARDESADISGVSHFLEHMMFKGTAKRTALDINYQLAAMGAQANAFTSERKHSLLCCRFTRVFSGSTRAVLGYAPRLALDPGEFETEKKVILEEIALYQDKPHFLVFESALREHFRGHTAGNSVLGTLDSVGALTRESMKSYFDSRYVPGNMLLVASGNFDFAELVSLAEQYCGSWSPGSAERRIVHHTPIVSRHELYKEQLTRAHVCLVSNAPSASDSNRFSSQVLSTIMGDSQGSRVYWDLVDKGLVDMAGIDTDEMDGTGIVVASASCDLSDTDQVIDCLQRILNTPLEFSEDELARAKTKIRTRLVLQGESSMRRLMSIGLDWLARKSYLGLEDELKEIAAVSRHSIAAMLEEFNFTPQTEVRLLPKQ